ncbi:MAG: TerC family protein [Acidobacteriales bacterium]|nr:TerC family protein [Terriglobales bacterium]
MHNSLIFWIGFNAFVLLMLALDLGVFHREDEPLSLRQALRWSLVWLALAAGFAALIYFTEGFERTAQFVTGYVIEQSLSVDNLFVFLLLFQSFRVPDHLRYRVLFWGVAGALIMRGLFIAVGVTLLNRFEWIVFFFGAILLFTAIRMLWRRGKHDDPSKSRLLTWLRPRLNITDDFSDGDFFIRRNGTLWATPLFLVLVLVEAGDVLFAVDSVPAVLAVSRNPFIVYTSNVFAILGLRSLYFVLADALQRFRYAPQAVAVILAFVGAKIVASPWYDVPTLWSLAIILLVLLVAIVASWHQRADTPKTA